MIGQSSLAAALALTMVSKIAILTGLLDWPQVPRLAALAVIVLAAGTGRFGLREIYLIGLSCFLAVLAVWLAPQHAVAGLSHALDQAAYLMCFIMALGLLQEAAARSSSIMSFGHWLIRQPPRRRFTALYGGSGLMSVVFNLGTVSFLMPLIQRGIAQGVDDGLNPIRLRRQVTALLRGFAWAVVWSPTAIAPVMVARLLPGVDRGRWIVLGLLIWGAMLVVAICEDVYRFRHVVVPPRTASEVPLPWPSLLRLMTVCLAFFGVALLTAWLAQADFITGLLVACPAITLAWLGAQAALSKEHGRGQLLARRLARIWAGFPGLAPVAITLACSGFIGYLASDLLPVDRLARMLDLAGMPDFLLLSLLPLFLMSLSMMALSPTMTAVFFGGLFGKMTELPVDPTLLALSISCGWALSLGLSPVSTPVLLINRASGLDPVRVSLRWNAAFGALSWLVLVVVFLALTTLGKS